MTAGEQVIDDMRPDESRAAGYEYVHGVAFLSGRAKRGLSQASLIM